MVGGRGRKGGERRGESSWGWEAGESEFMGCGGRESSKGRG